MSNQHKDQERWEVILTTLLLKFRPLLFIAGLWLLLYAVTVSFTFTPATLIGSLFAFFLFTLVFWDAAVLSVARAVAWAITKEFK